MRLRGRESKAPTGRETVSSSSNSLRISVCCFSGHSTKFLPNRFWLRLSTSASPARKRPRSFSSYHSVRIRSMNSLTRAAFAPGVSVCGMISSAIVVMVTSWCGLSVFRADVAGSCSCTSRKNAKVSRDKSGSTAAPARSLRASRRSMSEPPLGSSAQIKSRAFQ